MSNEKWTVGNVTITKIVEMAWREPVDDTAAYLSGSTPQEITDLEWMAPAWLADDQIGTSIHSFLIETPTRTILVDTGVGNDKKRTIELVSGLKTSFLADLNDVADVSTIDSLIFTHFHIDHVGWNTQLVDGKWVPTFPTAEYFFVQQEYDYWKHYAENFDEATYTSEVDQVGDGVAVFEDSIAPIVEAGLVTWVQPDARIAPEVTLIPTLGHTPGHVSIRIESEGETAVITGDLMYCACQVARPDWSSSMDLDAVESAHARKSFVEEFADTSTLILGTHFYTPSGGYAVSDGDSFKMIPA